MGHGMPHEGGTKGPIFRRNKVQENVWNTH
jgi:hypothetical protein